ncbi:DUF4438 domain-containing protein [Microvirga sp. BT689]|uniref:DUF4438 family protein n=1 Tax=Microvirga arvi TaxID=2778731 RepID=UPI0019506942|nr:DUF4438 domain-containing protein [Microvirga arvi]MBM6581904.1 DUF4438 domain-containing protein [Microvirga arvi]
MSVQTNEDRLVVVSVSGSIVHPSFPGLPAEPYRLAADGTPFLLPTFGGIVYNISVGDSAFGWMADCVHPGVSIHHGSDLGNRGLNVFACVGNDAMVMSGEGRGARGVVTGKSGRFSENVIVHFAKDVRRSLAVGDKIVIRATGVGMEVAGFPSMRLKSLSPRLFRALAPTNAGGKLRVPVVATIPAHLLGAGAGLTSEGGSLHIQTTDRDAIRAAGLDRLKLGDIVALEDYDSRYQHGYLRGAIGVAVIGQTDGPRAGYGPGMTLLMTDSKGLIEPVVQRDVNIATLLDLEA